MVHTEPHIMGVYPPQSDTTSTLPYSLKLTKAVEQRSIIGRPLAVINVLASGELAAAYEPPGWCP